MKLYYCVLKNYKGIFKKKNVGNTHLFFIPLPDNKYLYLSMIGEIEDQKGSYATQLVTKIPADILDEVIDGELEYFKDRYEVVEKVNAIPTEEAAGIYNIKISKKGEMILSDLRVEFNVDFSTNDRRIYTLTGKFNFESESVSPGESMKMVADKKIAYMGDKVRYESFSLKED